MPRPPLPEDQRAQKLGIRLAPDLHEWIERRVETNEFMSFTHAIDVALREMKHRIEARDELTPEVRRAIERAVAAELGLMREQKERSPARSRNTTSKK